MFEEIMVENFSKLMKTKSNRFKKINKLRQKKQRKSHITIKLPKTSDKQKIV